MYIMDHIRICTTVLDGHFRGYHSSLIAVGIIQKLPGELWRPEDWLLVIQIDRSLTYRLLLVGLRCYSNFVEVYRASDCGYCPIEMW